MTEAQNRAIKIACFALGIALPLAGFLLWRKTYEASRYNRRAHLNELQEKAVEDSFPASDPPASW